MGDDAVKKIWGMRKKAVGLLGNAKGEARPIPFVEDTAVPPENLADFIAEFRAILDSYQLSYGMFGHVDAGVLHVRPAIDMKDAAALAMVRKITDQVTALTQKYNGLLWGEHGKGAVNMHLNSLASSTRNCSALKVPLTPTTNSTPVKLRRHSILANS